MPAGYTYIMGSTTGTLYIGVTSDLDTRILLACTVAPFANGSLSPRALGIIFTIIFFIASSAASAAYLTISEIFPLEIRAFAIAIFYALGTLMGGVGAPILFGFLIKSGSRPAVAARYALGALLMIAAAICEHVIGVEAAGRSLESVSKPLQSSEAVLIRTR